MILVLVESTILKKISLLANYQLIPNSGGKGIPVCILNACQSGKQVKSPLPNPLLQGEGTGNHSALKEKMNSPSRVGVRLSGMDEVSVVIKQVEFTLRKLGLKLDQRLLNSFENWFKEITEENEESVEKSVSVESEASLEGGAPFIAKLMVKLLAQIKGSDKQKTTIRQTLEKDISV